MDEISSPPQPSPRVHRARRIAVATAVGIGLALGAAGIAAAADDVTQSPAPDANAKITPGPGVAKLPGLRGPHGHGRHGWGHAGALHGEFVVPDGNGGYRTVLTQRGVVTAVSTTSLTVKSEDGYTKTYALNPSTVVVSGRDGIGTVEKGESVAVMATEAGGTATATHVKDLTSLQELRGKRGPRRAPDEAPAPGGTPASPSSYRSQPQGA
jgi:hypothetical protein